MKEYFIKHRWHLIIFVVLILITGISGYCTFKISDLPTPPPASQAEALRAGPAPPLMWGNQNTPTSPTDNEYQTMDNDSTTTTEQQFSAVGGPAFVWNHLIIQPSDYKDIIAATSTVYDVMDKLQSQGKFSFKTKEFAGLGYFVEEINGVKQDTKAGKYWIYYINGESAKVGISNYILKPNDIIEWKYENTNL